MLSLFAHHIFHGINDYIGLVLAWLLPITIIIALVAYKHYLSR